MRSRISPLQLESKLAVMLDLISYYKKLKSNAETENIVLQTNFYKAILIRLLSRYCELAMQSTFFNMTEITTSGALYLLGVPYSEIDGRFYIHP